MKTKILTYDGEWYLYNTGDTTRAVKQFLESWTGYIKADIWAVILIF